MPAKLAWFCVLWLLWCSPGFGENHHYYDAGPSVATGYLGGSILPDEHFAPQAFAPAAYDPPTVKFTLDGYLFKRTGGDLDQPLILEAPFPAPASLTSGDIGLEGRMGGRADLTFYGAPGRFAPRAGVLWTGTETSSVERTGDPADVFFFNAVAADPASAYTARSLSRFTLADFGVRKTVSYTYGWSASFALGELIESLDLLSDRNSGPSTPGTSETGFFSQTRNEFYGFQLGLDSQLWTNGRSKIEGAITAGVFHNAITVGAQAQNAAQDWDYETTAFVGTLNLVAVIPADPVNFRLGYQGAYLSGMALPVSQSRDRSIISGAGGDPTDDVWYHGFLFGIEFLR